MEKLKIVLPTPTPQQQIFLDLDQPEQLYGGAKGGGKTFVGSLKATLLSCMIPGNRGMICRLNWPQLRDSTLETFKMVCPPELREWSASDRQHTIRTIDPKRPSTILWRSMGDPDDFEKAKGTELGWLWIDEPTEVPFDTYMMLRAQLRWKLPGGKFPPYMAFLTSNPEPGWVKERFISNMVKGGVYVPALPRDNPHLPPELVQMLRETMPDDWVKKYLEGSWNVGAGSVFKELDERWHVLENIDHSGMKLIGCIDHASTGVTAYLQVGIDADENIYALEEYYQKDRLISQHAKAMWSMMQRYGTNDYTLIDPSTEAKTIQRPDALYSVLDEYRRNGITARPARRASIEVGLNLLNEYIHRSPQRRHPRTQEPGAARLFICKSKCPNLWKEMTEIRKTILEKSDRVEYVGADHALDCLRYIAMSRPNAPLMDRIAAEYELQPNDPINRRADRAFAKWDKGFAKAPNANEWFDYLQ